MSRSRSRYRVLAVALGVAAVAAACGAGDDRPRGTTGAPSSASEPLVLRLDRKRVGPEAKLDTVLENRGRSELTAGNPYRLERRVAGLWVDLPQGLFTMIGYSLPAGGEHDLSVRLPADAKPGRYRITREASGATMGAGRPRTYSASAEFEVVAGD